MLTRSNGLLGSAAASGDRRLATWSRPFAHTRLVVVGATRVKTPVDRQPLPDTWSQERHQKANTDDANDEADHDSGLAPEVAGHACLSCSVHRDIRLPNAQADARATDTNPRLPKNVRCGPAPPAPC
jgi:hypothetical protein